MEKSNSDEVNCLKNGKCKILFKNKKNLEKNILNLKKKFKNLSGDLARELCFKPKSKINFQIFFLLNKEQSIIEFTKKAKIIRSKLGEQIQKKLGNLENIFLKKFSKEIEIYFFTKQNNFKNGLYFDREVIKQYEDYNDFWRISNSPILNINIFLPIDDKKESKISDETIVENNKNYIFLYNSENFEKKIKKIFVKEFGFLALRDNLTSEGYSFSGEFVVGLREKISNFSIFKEIKFFIESLIYVDNTMDLKVRDKDLSDLNFFLRKLENFEFKGKLNFLDIGIEAFELNMRNFYKTNYIYTKYR